MVHKGGGTELPSVIEMEGVWNETMKEPPNGSKKPQNKVMKEHSTTLLNSGNANQVPIEFFKKWLFLLRVSKLCYTFAA